MLMPGANLTSFGAVRDVEKWPARDRRRRKRDVIDFEEYNPYICNGFIAAVNTLHALSEADPDASAYNHKKAVIKPNMLRRGIGLYNKAVVASMGIMLSRGTSTAEADGSGRWLDIAGQYITKRAVLAILDAVDDGTIGTLEELDAHFRAFDARYEDYAHNYAKGLLAALLGHHPSAEEVAEAVTAGTNAHEAMRRTTDADRARDCSLDMAVSYGLDSDDETETKADYFAVRGLE